MDVMNDKIAMERAMFSEWAAREMQTVELGDKRRNEGLTRLLSSMAAMPSKSIPAAVNGGHNETTAANRLFDNDALDFVNILQPHIDATYKRVAEQDVVGEGERARHGLGFLIAEELVGHLVLHL